MSRKISQREAHRLRRRVRELEVKLGSFGMIDERVHMDVWAGTSNWTKGVRLIEKLGFEARVTPVPGDSDKLNLMAVRRRQ